MKTSENYHIELYQNVIPFWVNNSVDKEHGGFFTCLDRYGNVYDQDKFIWLQARQVWMFSVLYGVDSSKQEYLDIAIHGAKFLMDYGRDDNGFWYFSLTKEGAPLVVPYNIFSDCFAAMAFAALYKIKPEKEYGQIAKETFSNILKRQENPKLHYEKSIAQTRSMRSFSLPMILSNLSLEMEHLLDASTVDALTKHIAKEVIQDFYKPELGVVLENIASDGSLIDSFSGRLVNPGHGLESMWFLMDVAHRKSDDALMHHAVKISLEVIQYGWDKQNGGIFYFLDRLGHPPEQLEWDQKLWWVHLEAMVCMIKAYKYTGEEVALKWFQKLEEYTWKHFKDPEGKEWFGYLRHDASVLLPLKGGKWKGCFHVPRALLQISNSLAEIEREGYQAQYPI